MDHIDITPDPSPPVYLSIPFNAESALPGRSLSVTEILQHEFPSPFWAPCGSPWAPAWSNASLHQVRLVVLLTCGVPQRELLRKLLFSVQGLQSAPRSINRAALSSCEALPSLLPIWVLSFWDHLSEAYITCMSRRKCLNWVDPPFANRQRVTELGSLMDRLPWHGYIGGKRRDRHVNDVFDLLSNSELNTSQMRDLLELVERRLADIPDNRYLIAPTELSALLLYSYKNHMEDTYQKNPIQQLVEEDLIQPCKSVIASIAWTSVGGRGHWITFIVDPIASEITHSDSLGRPLPDNLRDALKWWLSDLQREMGELTMPLRFNQIPVTCQNDDFSCGILSTNSLAHYLLPHWLPLVQSNAASVKTYRIKCTVEILKLSIPGSPVCLSRHVIYQTRT